MKAPLTIGWHVVSFAPAAMLLTLSVATAAAQPPPGPPNALQGFSQNRNEPINITSASLEVRDKEKIATFIDNVRLVQGDTVLECKLLIVYYDEEAMPVGKVARPAQQPTSAKSVPAKSIPAQPGQQQIRRLEAKGGVIVTQKDQTAIGESGVFDMKTNVVTLTGKVVVSQGQNVVRGDRLWVDLNTNVSRVESSNGGPVNAIFLPGSRDQIKPAAAAAPAAPAARAGAAPDQNKPKPSPSRPLKLN